MGKASRRKSERKQLPCGFFLDVPIAGNQHMVWLGIRAEQRDYHRYLISAHYRIEDALFSLFQCQKSLNECRDTYLYFDPSHNYFWNKLMDVIDRRYSDSNCAGIRSEGCSVDGKTNRWKVEKVPLFDNDRYMYKNKQFYGDPCGYYKFFARDDSGEDPRNSDLIHMVRFDCYESAAKIADYLNSNTERLTRKTVIDLVRSLDNYCKTIFPSDSYYCRDRDVYESCMLP